MTMGAGRGETTTVTRCVVPRARVLLVEDEPWIRRSIEQLMGRPDSGVELVTAKRGREAIARAVEVHPDVALVDLGLPDVSGIHVIAELRRQVPACVPVVFTVFDDAPTILAALRAGARGYILKSTPTERLIPALEAARDGGLPLSPGVASLVVETMLGAAHAHAPGHDAALTERETELLGLLARGMTYAECAAVLGIGVGTVQGYVKCIYAKLDVSSKAEAAVVAARLGLV